MESTNAMNDFIGSTMFSCLMILGVVAIGVILKLTFRSSGSDYTHRPDQD
jgi:hypothetical protein